MREKPIQVLSAGHTSVQAGRLEEALAGAGFSVLTSAAGTSALEARVRELKPDVVVMHADRSERETLDFLTALSRTSTTAVVLLCYQSDRRLSRAAAQAGVSLYVVDELSSRTVQSLVDMALLHFQDHQLLRQELERTRQTLEDLRAIADAKCLLMERKGLSEADSYHQLRRLAMNRGQRLGDLARALLAASTRVGTALA